MIKILVDVHISDYIREKDVTYYKVKLTAGNDDSTMSWILMKRFKQFDNLHKSLSKIVKDVPKRPPKTFFKMTKPESLNRRKKKLENYCIRLLTRDDLLKLACVKQFFALPLEDVIIGIGGLNNKDNTFCSLCSKRFLPGVQALCCVRCKKIIYDPMHPLDDLYIDPNQILEYLWLGPQFSAVDKAELEKRNIQKIVRVGVNESFPILPDIEYHKIKVEDSPKENIAPFFESATVFIDTALKESKSVLVHCQMGVSRSSSIVIAYLMQKKGLDVTSAMRFVRSKRPIIKPNEGFLCQLYEYEKDLKKKGIID